MRAALYYGKEDIRIEQVDEPEIGPDDVKLRVLFAGICGSDLQEYYSGPRRFCSGQPHPTTGVGLPAIIGHELSGEVVETGRNVSAVQVGELVAVEPVAVCGECLPCLTGRGHCRHYTIHGYTRAGGGFSQYTTVTERMAHPLPVNVGASNAALVEPLSVGMLAAKRTALQAGSTAAVHGAGPIGIGVILALRAHGVTVIVSEPSTARRSIVDALGVDRVLDPAAVDCAEAIRDMTGGVGVDASVDAAGAPAALEAAIRSTAEDGRVVLTANPLRPMTISPQLLHASKVFLTTSTGTSSVTQAFDDVIALMAEGHYLSSAWTQTIALDDLIAEGFEPLRRGEKVKVLVDMARTGAD